MGSMGSESSLMGPWSQRIFAEPRCGRREVFSAIDRWRMAAASIRWMAFAFCFGIAAIDRWMAFAAFAISQRCWSLQRVCAGWLLQLSAMLVAAALLRWMAFAIPQRCWSLQRFCAGWLLQFLSDAGRCSASALDGFCNFSAMLVAAARLRWMAFASFQRCWSLQRRCSENR